MVRNGGRNSAGVCDAQWMGMTNQDTNSNSIYDDANHVMDYVTYWQPRLRRLTNECLDRLEDLASVAGCSVVDLGAGAGGTTAELLTRGTDHVVAVEPAPLMRSRIAPHELLDANGTSLPLGRSQLAEWPGAFDICTLHFVVHAIASGLHQELFRQAWSMLRPGGFLICADWRRDGPSSDCEDQIMAVIDEYSGDPDDGPFDSESAPDLLGLCEDFEIVHSSSKCTETRWDQSDLIMWQTRIMVDDDELDEIRQRCKRQVRCDEAQSIGNESFSAAPGSSTKPARSGPILETQMNSAC